MTNAIDRRASGPHGASNPWSLGLAAWKTAFVGAWNDTGKDNIGLIASGVAFYGFLALVPLLGAIVLIYGLVAEPATVVHDVTALTAIMPHAAAGLIGEQLLNVVHTSDGKKGLGLLLALALALFGARNGAGAVVTALNIAYDETETRSFVRVNLLALAITAVAVMIAILALVAVASLGHLRALVPGAPAVLIAIGKVISYVVLTLAAAAGAATLYRYGPSRAETRWVWLTPGSALAALLWLGLTLGFGIYVANFGNYNATYGSLGAVVVLLTWLYLSSYILLFGAELNAEFEVQKTPAPNAPGIVPEAAKPRHSLAADYAAGRVTARVAGLREAGMLQTGVATIGLALIRRRGRARAGMALLACAAGAAWLTRQRTPAPGRIQAVLFDLDGTLVDSNDYHVEAWDEAFRDADHPIDRAVIRGQIGKGGDLLVPALMPHAPEAVQQAIAKAHGEIFHTRYLDRVRPFPGASALVRRVHDAGQRVVLASSAERRELKHYARLLGIADILDAQTSIDDVATSKPAGDIFAAAIAKLGAIPPAAVLAIGDTPYDVEAAAKAGAATVAVRSGGFSDDALAGAVAIYDGVAALVAEYDASPLAR